MAAGVAPAAVAGVASAGGSLCRRKSMGSAPPSGLELRRAAAVVLPEAFKVLPAGPGPRFDSDRVNPCFKPRAPAHGRRLCIPYFYILGQFHSGAFDLYERISHHPSVAHRPPAASRFNGEVHAWEKMMWRGCDYGSCPRRRGAGAEPIPLPAALASDRGAVFGEVMGSGLSFTWGSTHSLMHSTYTANMTACWRAGFRGPRQQVCYGRAMAAQSEWERSIGAGKRYMWARGAGCNARHRPASLLSDENCHLLCTCCSRAVAFAAAQLSA